MSLLPPWVRLAPWLMSLVMSLLLWGMWERGDKLSERVATAQAVIAQHKASIGERDQIIEALRNDARENNAILAERERIIGRIGTQLRGIEREVSRLHDSAAPGDCIRQPIGPDVDRVLDMPPDPAAAGVPEHPGEPPGSGGGGAVGRQPGVELGRDPPMGETTRGARHALRV